MKVLDVPLGEEKGLSVGTGWAVCGGPGWLWTSGQEDGCQARTLSGAPCVTLCHGVTKRVRTIQ